MYLFSFIFLEYSEDLSQCKMMFLNSLGFLFLFFFFFYYFMNISSLHCSLTSIFVTGKLISWTNFWIVLLFSFNLFSIFSSTLSKVFSRASLVAQRVKNPPAMQESWLQSLRWEDPLEEGTLQYSCLENPHGQRRWTGHGATKSQTGLTDLHLLLL